MGWLLLRFGAPFLDGGVLGFFPRLVPLLPLTAVTGHYLQQASVGRVYLLAYLSRAHLVNAMHAIKDMPVFCAHVTFDRPTSSSGSRHRQKVTLHRGKTSKTLSQMVEVN